MNTQAPFRIFHIVNDVSPTSIPYEVARRSNPELFDTTVVSFYDGADPTTNGIENASVICLGARGKLDPRPVLRLHNAIRKVKPHIVHVHHNISGSVGRVLAKIARVPVIVDTEHNDHRGFRALGKLLNGITLNLADAIVCNSKNTEASFAQWEDRLIDARKKRVIYNGVDIDLIDTCAAEPAEVRSNWGFASSDFLIGNVGMLFRQKDQATLIRAMPSIVDELPQAQAVVIGDGPLKDSLKELAQRLGVERHVRFMGLLSREDVYEVLHGLDLFVMISLWEGFCNAVVEAMAARLPVIVSDVPPLPEVVGDSALYVPSQQPAALSEAILSLNRNPARRKHLGQLGRDRAVRKYALERTVQDYEALYCELLQRAGFTCSHRVLVENE